MSLNIMTTGDFCTYLGTLIPELDSILVNGFVNRNDERSVGVVMGPDTRRSNSDCYGGAECSNTRKLPVNIVVRYGNDTAAFDTVANGVFAALKEVGNNFTIASGTKIAFVQLLDDGPVGHARDLQNIIEAVIRADIIYYI